MVKANELRIGNKLTRNDVFVTVNGIATDGVYVEGFEAKIPFEDLEPFHLTHAVLHKFGFEISEEKSIKDMLLFYSRETSIASVKVFIWAEKNEASMKLGSQIGLLLDRQDKSILQVPITDVRFVHELQNFFFSVAKEELEMCFPDLDDVKPIYTITKTRGAIGSFISGIKRKISD